MNMAGGTLPYNATMRAAYKAANVPLWVTPHEAADRLRYEGWSVPISIELGEWFSRVWSMAFASGYLGLKAFTPKREQVLRLLERMGYDQGRRAELANLMLYNLDGLHRKGVQQRSMEA